ncbi:MAG: bifunctional 4-hydroxy-2-oxoglutarate aldolase/2-dehydro-3-deoxy-phosphogluconate aldolase [Sandaracinus sp.]|nr:bifunctional 4-hydroxy-2-oxoglutarate aldolase/2-dehydro-3-deoxy-phosphogluconate aldolase [Sandaracinus sp.]
MSSTLALIREHGLLAVIDAPIEERVFDWAMAVSKGGIELLGIPVTLGNVTEIVSDLGDAELTVGITGVVQAEQVSIAVAAGAEFLISPVVDEEIIATSKNRGLVTIVGAFTPTEVHRALRAGADLVAIHPAGALGSGIEYFRRLCQTFAGVPLLAAGGIDVENAPAFLEAGAAAAVVDRGVFPTTNDPSATDVIAMRAVALVEVCAEMMGTPKRASFTELRGELPPKDGTMEILSGEFEDFELE